MPEEEIEESPTEAFSASWGARICCKRLLVEVLLVGVLLMEELSVFSRSGSCWMRAVEDERTELVACESPLPGGPGIIAFQSFFGSNSI